MSLALITVTFDPPILGVDVNAAFSVKVDQLFGTDLPFWTSQANDLAVSLVATASAANYSANSVTAHDIGTGEKTWIVDEGKIFVPGQFLTIANTASPGDKIYGEVKSYDLENGELVFDCLRVFGSGTGITAWSLGLSAPQGIGGDVWPDFAGKARMFFRVNPGETDGEYFAVGWTVLGTISGASMNGAATVAFSGIDIANYSRLMVTGKAYTAASVTYTFKVGDGATTEIVGSFAAQQYTKHLFVEIEHPACDMPLVRCGSHTYTSGNAASAASRVAEIDDLNRIQIDISGDVWSASVGLTLYGAV